MIQSDFCSESFKEEIVLDLPKGDMDGKIMLQCIDCGKEFDPKAREHKDIPTVNFCSRCYKPDYIV